MPDEVKPHPPFVSEKKRGKWLLIYDESSAKGSEATVLGGLKTKDVDVVVEKGGVGPVIAVSCKGTGKSFRNLTNRMEEAVGECTNLHMTYSALVTGYFSLFRAHREGADPNLESNDIAIQNNGEPVDGVIRYHEAFRQLEGREDLRDVISKYEAVSLTLLETSGDHVGTVMESYPPADSPLRVERFFDTIYKRYDERFVFAAPIFVRRNVTPRIEWSPESPIFQGEHFDNHERPELDYEPRMANGEGC